MTQDTAGTVTLHTAAGVEPVEVDTTTDLYQINVEAFAQAVQGQGQPTATRDRRTERSSGRAGRRAIAQQRLHRRDREPAVTQSTKSHLARDRSNPFKEGPS